ncbi:acetyl-coenzyme a transporter 1 [Stylonychia lemnae]|uniref:Acetyl-coenzyme a transporter 1 n=1 Tax=Stylonychia lemnae TaxID=5949 RepID=A0A078A2W7_STYLE|nr:acetyl-coenzyme a transporter 1 [Stylonychia lemnae]|eukprot:CDW76460.1 acetyl-coenzyme a transporter 1 [Stylonychia lemnae]
MILLSILYSFQVIRFFLQSQGLPLGLFLSSFPIIFKKYLTYSEIGIMMMCTVPFSFKILWSPFVDLYYIKSIGKRKSWIVPSQILISMMLFYMSGSVEEMLINKEIYLATSLFTVMIFIITCQDIAVDSWAVEILDDENSTYASTCQSIGQKVGSLGSSSLFMAFNSEEFCNQYVYSSPQEKPLLTISNFMLIWAYFQFAVSIYILLFVNENQKAKVADQEAKGEQSHNQDVSYSLTQTFSVLKDLISNQNMITFTLFFLGYFGQKNVFSFVYKASIVCVIIVNLEFQLILVILLSTFSLASSFSSNCLFNVKFAIIFKICDKRISGLFITLMATLSNLSWKIHQIYIFEVVELFGLFGPQLVITVFVFAFVYKFKERFCSLDNESKESWAVSESVLKSMKND